MEEGQKINISLESELDIKSSDMLVTIDEPLFQHNRQQYQGHYMPTSLRFEHDGWAAGWDVYNFKFDTVDFKVGEFYVSKARINDVPTYVIAFNKEIELNKRVEYAHLFFNAISVADNGVTADKNTFTGSIDGRQFSLSLVNNTAIINDPSFSVDLVVLDNNRYNVIVKDENTHVNDDIVFNVASDLYNGDILFAKLLSISGDKYSFNGATFENNRLSTKFGDTSLDNGKFVYNTTVRLNANISLESETFTPRLNSVDLNVSSNTISSYASADYSFNRFEVDRAKKKSWNIGESINIAGWLPYWCGKNISLSKNNVPLLDKKQIGTISNIPIYIKTTESVSVYDGIYREWHVRSWTGPEYIDLISTGVQYQKLKINISVAVDDNTYRFTDTIDSNFLSITDWSYDEWTAHEKDITQAIIVGDNLSFTGTAVISGTYTIKVDNIVYDYVDDLQVVIQHNYISTYRSNNIIPQSTLSGSFYSCTIANDTSFITAGCYKGYFNKKITLINEVKSTNVLDSFSITDDGSNNRFYIDRDAHKWIDISIIDGSVTNGMVINIVPINNYYYYYASEQQHYYCPSTIYFNDIQYADIPTPTMGVSRDNIAFNVQYSGSEINRLLRVKQCSISNENKYDTKDHVFKSKVIGLWNSSASAGVHAIQYTGSGDSLSATQNVYFYINNNTVLHCIYDCINNIFTFDLTGCVDIIDDYTINVLEPRGNSSAVTFTISVPVRYELSFNKASTDKGSILSMSDGIYNCIYNNYKYSVVPDEGYVKFVDKKFSLFNNISHVDYYKSIEFTATLQGPYRPNNCSIVSYDNNHDTLVVLIDSNTYSLNCSTLLSIKNNMQFVYTDTRDEVLAETNIATVDPDKEYQFLKQCWDTTSKTDNFWWIDDKHILTLEASKFILTEKTNELDDWNGNKFITVNEWTRSSIFNRPIVQYGCTSAYNSHALFWTLEVNSDNSIKIIFYDPNENMQSRELIISIKKREIGEQLNVDNKCIYSYTNITAQTLTSLAKISSTHINNHILFGIHFSKNFNQWTIVIDNNFNYTVLQGYGYVGIDGSLTGGEIPAKFFDISKGFNSIVKPLDILKDDIKIIEPEFLQFNNDVSKLNEIYNIDIGDNTVVGTDTKQWYICTNISEIVSHLTFDGNIFTAHMLPITNNLSQRYDSASDAISMITDLLPFAYNIKDILSPNGMNDVMKIVIQILDILAGDPSVYTFFPKLSIFFELQQTFGQAAYVHHNSADTIQFKDKDKIDDNIQSDDLIDGDLKARKKDYRSPISSAEISFNAHTIPQSAELNGIFEGVLTTAGIFANDIISATQTKTTEVAARTGDKGYGIEEDEYMSQLLDAQASVDNVIMSVMPSVKSVVTGALSLDMFYSTSDDQQINAGPGFVQHNYVAQCVAQSQTVHHMAIRQYGIFLTLKRLTLYMLDLKIKLVHMAIEGIDKLRDDTRVESVFGNVIGGFAAAIMLTGEMTLYGTWVSLKAAYPVIEDIVDSLSKNGIKSSLVTTNNSDSVDPEGKHSYGKKFETFMWPCFGAGVQHINDESVEVVSVNTPWEMHLDTTTDPDNYDSWLRLLAGDTRILNQIGIPLSLGTVFCKGVVSKLQDIQILLGLKGKVPYYVANVSSVVQDRALPDKMAYVIGADTLLSKKPFRNKTAGEEYNHQILPAMQDYVVDSRWQIGYTAADGYILHVSCKDTKILDCPPSNMVISDTFCGIASSYCALEVKHGIRSEYVRPYNLTPNVLALNQTGKNCCYDRKVYHAFDGYGYRVVSWCGAPGINKYARTDLYAFINNCDRFKRSNILPPNEFYGNFTSAPVIDMCVDDRDTLFINVMQPEFNKGLTSGTASEDKDASRLAIPVFAEPIQVLPASIKTLSSMTLNVIDGVTSLTTVIRDMNDRYKAPVSVDFTIGKNVYRFSDEYICSVKVEKGITVVEELVACLGLIFIGSTPFEAYLYSPSNKQYYTYSGGTTLTVVDTIERFRNMNSGSYDFINQEVVTDCLATFDRLDSSVKDDTNETDNVIVPRIKDHVFIGEVWPPIDTIYNTKSSYKIIPTSAGIVYQGPNRCIINRYVLQDYMIQQIKDNYGKWKRLPREKYNPFRKYSDRYVQVNKNVDTGVIGWTHNPFLLVTAPLGISDNIDCIFEWEITFCWPIEMDKLYNSDNYATVNLQAETMTLGGKVIAERPTHIYLTKNLFTRTDNYGYYSFRYQSNCGIGNRERLHIWSDQYIAISNIQLEYKPMTTKRTEQLTQHINIQQLHEI